MDYIDRMIATREDSDETQRDLSKKIKYAQPQIARYERRINEPPIRYLIDFCHHYKVSADYILGLPSYYKKPREIKYASGHTCSGCPSGCDY